MKVQCLLLMVIVSLTTIAQTTRYVKPVATGAGDGSSWANASNELQNMIDASVAGDEVWVAQGVYYPTEYPTGCTNCTSGNHYTFSLKTGVAVYGGFQGTETLLSQRQYNLFPTILDGDLDQDGVLDAGNVYSVVTALNTTSTSVLDGVQIRNGYANGGPSVSAGSPAQSVFTTATGGIYCWNAASIIRNCKITNCWGYSGGGLYSRNSTLQILNCVFDANLNGGGLGIVSSTTLIDKCLFINNQAGNYGGGIYNDTPNSTITNCSFINNSAIRGGGISNYSGGNLVLANCLFAGNTASAEGGAIHNTFFSSGNAVNCTFYNNTSPLGSLVWNWSSVSCGVINSIVYGHAPGTLTGFSNGGSTPSVSYSLLEENLPGTGNVIGNPLFANLSDLDGPDNLYGTADDGLIPSSSSPAVNMGNNASVPAGITMDITGFTRISGGIVNAGAYEVVACTPPGAPVNTTIAELTCPGGTTTLSASGSGTSGWYSAASGGTYLGGGTTFTTPALAGTTTFYVQDSTCAAGPRTAIIAQVGDTIDPGITLPSDTILYINNGACSIIFNYTVSTSDNCGLPSISQLTGLASGGSFPIGVTQNTYEVTDVAGNVVSASFTVTVVNQTASSQSVTICSGETYSIGSSTYGTAGTYTDTLQSSSGCDSLVTTQLTVLPNASFSQQFTLCAGESVSVGNSTYSLTGTYQDTLQAANGCDSLITTQVTVLPNASFSQQFTLCAGESVSVGNSTYSLTGTYQDTLQAANGCDSLITTQVTVLPNASFSQQFTLCVGESVSVGNSTYFMTGTYQDTLQSANGCDSLVTTDLVVLPLPDNGVTLQQVTLTADANGAVYQWIDCGTQQAISGANNQTYSPTVNGWYAVVVTEGNCSDTSECMEVSELSIEEQLLSGWEVIVSPNPATHLVVIQTSQPAVVTLLNAHGQEIQSYGSIASSQQMDVSDLSRGVYFLRLESIDGCRIVRLVKE